MINGFKGKYFFLSNFYKAPVNVYGLPYTNNEAAFQSMKTTDMEKRREFVLLDPSSAKAKGRRIKLRGDWEQIKFNVMYNICLAKFLENPDLKEKLLDTGDEYLEEGNTWGDKIWGTVNGEGENNLGKILMEVRSFIRNPQPSQFYTVEFDQDFTTRLMK